MVSDATARVAGDGSGENTVAPPGRALYRLLSIYNVYRATLALGLLAPSIINGWADSVLNGYHTGIIWLAGIWLTSAVVIGRLIATSTPWVEGMALAVVLLDLVAVAVLVQLGSGLSEGLPLLYLVTVAAGAVLITQRLTATAIAALASLAVLLGTAAKLSSGAVTTGEWVYAGLLGGLSFALSLFLQHIVTRLTSAEERVETASSHIATLEELNHQIIADMTTGVCRVTANNFVIPMNDAAVRLLGLAVERSLQPLGTVSPALEQYVAKWRLRENPNVQPIVIECSGRHILPKLLHLGSQFEADVILAVEDFTAVSETAQMMKLKSLGKLTASIAHEIRNPLTAISHAIQLMEEPIADPDEAATLRQIVLNNTGRVNDIVENILQLSRSQATAQQAIDLGTWLPTAISEYEQTHSERVNVTLRMPDKALLIRFDSGNLRRVLTNLLDNAIRHAYQETGQRAAAIEVTDDTSSNSIYLDVIDAGSGVPEEHLDRLFEPFFTTRPEGSGLGLYLSRELCAANRSTLSYARTDAGHSRFRVTLPRAEGEP